MPRSIRRRPARPPLLPPRRHRCGRGERGFSLLELTVAIGLIGVVATGFLMTAAAGFRAVALARQRQTAADVASARLEHLRNVPYGQVALATLPARVADPDHPDGAIALDGMSYDVTGEGDYEPLVVDPAGGVLHLEDPVEIGRTVLEIYQYVTWVDDPAVAGTQDYRRVTVVVRYKAPAQPGVARTVRVGSVFTPGVIELPGTPPSSSTSTTVAATTTTTTTTASTTTTTVPADPACAGDATPPVASMTVNGNTAASAGFTASTSVSVRVAAADPCGPVTFALSADGATWEPGRTHDPVNPAVSWALGSGDGTKPVWARVADGAGNATTLGPVAIVLDTTAPSAPVSLTRSVGCSGAERTVGLVWSPAGDANLKGYRIYRSTDGATWSELATTSALGLTDVHAKVLDSVRYRVVAYDSAGNESAATTVVALTKLQCT